MLLSANTASDKTDSVIGSFFFIYHPKMKNSGDEDKALSENEKNASFEFLHKTFYEFLVADILLECLMNVIDDLEEERSGRRGEEHYRNALDGLPNAHVLYFQIFGGACLCVEPEIIKMVEEWKASKIGKWFSKKSDEDFIDRILKDIFDKHTEMIRDGLDSSLRIIKEDSLVPDRPYPRSCAIYLMNLLTIRIITSQLCEIEAEKWSFLAQYIKLNMPLANDTNQAGEGRRLYKFQLDPTEEMLLRFMSLFQVVRKDDSIIFSKRIKELEFDRKDLLEARMEIFLFCRMMLALIFMLCIA